MKNRIHTVLLIFLCSILILFIHACVSMSSPPTKTVSSISPTRRETDTSDFNPLLTPSSLATLPPNIKSPAPVPLPTPTENSSVFQVYDITFSNTPETSSLLYIGIKDTGIDIPNLPGSDKQNLPSFIDKDSSDEYLVLDFMQKKTNSFQTFPNCHILTKNNSAFCIDGQNSFMLNLKTGVKESLPCNIPTNNQTLKITPSNSIVYYAIDPNISFIMNVVACDLRQRVEKLLATLDAREWNYDLPRLSDSGKYLLGTSKPKGSLEQSVYRLFNLELSQSINIYSEIDPYATDDISWAYGQDLVLLGAQDKRINLEAGSCPSHLFTYNAMTRETSSLFNFPLGKCADMFAISDLESPTLWSPDNQYVALLRAYELCVIRITSGGSSCYPIPESGAGIDDYEWSPDSQWIALILEGSQLNLFSIKTGTFFPIGFITPDWMLKKYFHNLIWVAAP